MTRIRWKEWLALGGGSILVSIFVGYVMNRDQIALIDGTESLLLSGATMMGVILVVAWALAAPLGLLMLVSRGTRSQGIRIVVASMVFFIGMFLFNRLNLFEDSGSHRRAVFEAFDGRSKTLIAAIRDFEKVHGVPPSKLTALVPDYFQEIPGTGIDGYPKFGYESGATTREHYCGNPWILTVNTPDSPMDFSQLMYLPNQNYEELRYSAKMRFGDWVYLPD